MQERSRERSDISGVKKKKKQTSITFHELKVLMLILNTYKEAGESYDEVMHGLGSVLLLDLAF